MAEGGVTISNIQGSSIHADAIVGRDFIQYITNGPSKLLVNYGKRIEDFLKIYIGDVDLKVPFGGREQELFTLNQWLNARDTPRCLLLTAEAGRGKSALLVQWCSQVKLQGDVEVVFVPVSIRVETAAADIFYPSLAARLAVIFGEEVTSQFSNTEQAKDKCRDYLQQYLPDNKRVLVVLDGLDEAIGGWELGERFFNSVSSTFRVVVSARTEAIEDDNQWRKKLGWASHANAKSLNLSLLTLEGIQEVLRMMGDSALEILNHKEIVTEIFRLTEGDPLLLQLYVGKITKSSQNNAWTIQTLQNLKPGLDEFFEEWLKDQRKQWEAKNRQPLRDKSVVTVLGLLATAFGPLSKSDLIALSPKDSDVRSWGLEEILGTIRRFIVGDGEKQNVVFSHPRLSNFFFNKFVKDDDPYGWNQRFVEHGEKFISKIKKVKANNFVKEAESNSYIIQYYVAHLLLSDELLHEKGESLSLDKYYSLICHEWVQAWEALRGTYDGFLSDLQTVWHKSENDPDLVQSMTMQIWCALCQSSIMALSSNLAPELLAGATLAGVLSKRQALVWLKQNRNEDDIALSIELLVQKTAIEQEFAEQLLGLAQNIQNEPIRVQALRPLAQHLPHHVLKATQTLEDEEGKAEVLLTLAPLLPKQVLEIAQGLSSQWNRTRVLGEVAPHLPEGERAVIFQEVLNAVQGIKNRKKWTILNTLVPYLPNAVLELVQISSFEALGREFITIRTDDESIVEVLIRLSVYLPQEILKAIPTLKNPRWKLKVLLALAPHLPKQVLRIAQTLDDEWRCARVLSVVALYLDEEERTTVCKEALELTGRIWHDVDRVTILNTLSAYLPQEKLKAAWGLGDNWSRAKVLGGVVSYLPEPERIKIYEEILNLAREIKDEKKQVDVLFTLGPYRPWEVWAIAQEFWDEGLRMVVLNEVAPYLEEANRKGIYQEVIKGTRIIHDHLYRAALFSALACYIPQKIFHLTRNVQDDKGRAMVLSALSGYFPTEVLDATIEVGGNANQAMVLSALSAHLPERVLEVAYGIKVEQYFAEVLVALAPYLPERVLEVARRMKYEGYVAEVLAALAPYLAESVLEIARRMKDGGHVAEILAALAPYLPERVLEVTYGIKDSDWRTMTIATLVAHLPEGERTVVLNEALEVARRLINEERHLEVLAELLTYLPESERAAVCYEALEVSRRLINEERQIEMLARLVIFLPRDAQVAVRQEILNRIHRITDERKQAEKLRMVMPHLLRVVEKYSQSAKTQWTNVLLILSDNRRSVLLSGLEVLMKRLVDDIPSPSSVKDTTLTDNQRQQLLLFLEDPILLNTLTRIHFLEDAGLKKLITYLHFDVPQAIFVRNLLDRCITFGIDTDTGIPYLTKLLRHLKDTVWVGQPEPRTFVEQILDSSPTSPAQTRLAKGILEAVQAVCRWWP